MGDRTQATLICSDMWFENVACGASVAGNQPPNKQTNRQKKYCFLCDQEDVLRGGWSVELEAVGALAGLRLHAGPTGVMLPYS